MEYVHASKSAFKELRKDYVGRCSYADIVVPIEVKIDHGRCAFEFKLETPHPTRVDCVDGCEALGQFGHYIATVFGRQHRTHVLSLYVYRYQARMVFADRSMCAISKPFNFGTRQHPTLHRFFWRLAHLTREQLGYDPTVTRATPDEFNTMYSFATNSKGINPYTRERLLHALCVGKNGPDFLTSNQWPLQKMTRGNGECVFVGKPTHASFTLLGRSTRGYAGFIPRPPRVCFAKDSWRIQHEEVHPEHLVYEELERFGVEYIPKCLGGEDVQTSSGSPQVTCIAPLVKGSIGHDSGESFPYETLLKYARTHYRLFMDKILRPLTDFYDFSYVPEILKNALSGECSPTQTARLRELTMTEAHKGAWELAKVLHRDISVNNIMIEEFYDKTGMLQEARGVLCDWDLCKHQDQMNKGPQTGDRTVSTQKTHTVSC